MDSSSTSEPPAIPGEGQRQALVSLLADDDPVVYRAVRQKILSYGHPATGWMRRHTLSNNRLLRRRAQEIVDHFTRLEADARFLAFCTQGGEEFDLEQAAFLLARTRYPGINVEGYTALLDNYAADLRERLDLNGSPEIILAVINRFLFEELRFAGNDKHYFDPENSYLNRVLDRRTGNHASLCLVYLLLARRLRLPMVGVCLPGHFVCRHQTSRCEYYVDVFNRGRVLSKADCVQYLLQIRHHLDEGCLAAVSSRRILLRICANLHQIYAQLKQPAEADRLQRYLVALAR